MGKPSKYQTHVKPFLDKIESWVTQGGTQAEIAENLHITPSTLALYLAKGRNGEEPYSELSELFARAVREPNEKVEAALYKLATGYTLTLEKTFKVRVSVYDPATGRKTEEREELVTGPEQVHVPPNVNAQIFYLTNRLPEKWRHKPAENNAEGDDSTGVVLMPELAAPTPSGKGEQP